MDNNFFSLSSNLGPIKTIKKNENMKMTLFKLQDRYQIKAMGFVIKKDHQTGISKNNLI